MALKEYRRKRAFGKTPEPKSSPAAGSGGGHHFVVQKHQASHLHYDLRLEHAGVLKSWAVPKGPSMDPRDKRLAIQVEDHPLAYKDFKGRIPEGQYGAGLVEIWDKGTYTLTEPGPGQEGRSMDASLAKGHIDFTLKGKRLKGAFTLVRIKRQGDKDNQWLLMKRTDRPPAARTAARAGADPPSKPSRTPSPEDLDLTGEAKAPTPTEMRRRLATLVDWPFDR